jgi:hypothetical protein
LPFFAVELRLLDDCVQRLLDWIDEVVVGCEVVLRF